MSRILQRGLSAPAAARFREMPSFCAKSPTLCTSSSLQPCRSITPTGLHSLHHIRNHNQRNAGTAVASTSPAAAERGSSQEAVTSGTSAASSTGQQELPSLVELVASYGARLTTAAQMIWAQVLQPGDVAVDATCGNGHDTLFIAQQVGRSGAVYGIDLQESAVECTRQLLAQQLPAAATPQLHLVHSCHSRMQAIVGSNVAKLIAFNLGYLPGGDKSIVTRSGSTIAAVEAALEVVCPGGLVSIMCYIGHPGGQEEYDEVRSLLAGLSPSYWTSSELKLINRPTAPVLLLLWRRPDTHEEQKLFVPGSQQ